MSWLTTVLAQVDDDGARDQDARHGILTVRRPQATGRLDSAARPNRAWHAPNVAAVHCRAECRGTPLGWFAAFNCQFPTITKSWYLHGRCTKRCTPTVRPRWPSRAATPRRH